jgi:hypothetical protein
MYITRFDDATYRPLAHFEEDVDVTRGSVPGVTLRGDSLSTWKEAVVPFRWRGSNQGHNAVTLGWNRRIAGDDTTRRGASASYAVQLADSLRDAWRIGEGSAFVFALAPTDAKPGPRQPAKDSSAADSAKRPAKPKARPRPRDKSPARDTVPLDLTIEATDAGGRVARVALSAYGVPRRPLETFVYRRAGRDKQRFAQTAELVLQSYAIPLADFARATPGFEPGRVTQLRFLFDRTEAGTILLDNIGIARASRDEVAPGAGGGR